MFATLGICNTWFWYLELNRKIAKDCRMGTFTFVIHPAYLLIEPLNSLPWEPLSHGLPHIRFFYIMKYLICVTVSLFRADKIEGFLGFYISNLLHALWRLEARRFWQDWNSQNIVFRHFAVEYHNRWTALASSITSICGEHEAVSDYV